MDVRSVPLDYLALDQPISGRYGNLPYTNHAGRDSIPAYHVGRDSFPPFLLGSFLLCQSAVGMAIIHSSGQACYWFAQALKDLEQAIDS